jgi:hypothetical protein
MLKAFIYKIRPAMETMPKGIILPGRIVGPYKSEQTLFRYGIWPRIPKDGTYHEVEIFPADRIYGTPLKTCQVMRKAK